ncbi:hypothetical protein KY313_00970 [Candidatus Woesearchaeota archaeon]|nr:hypothetical protein [Candidatus Woesearchaeota archaeon]
MMISSERPAKHPILKRKELPKKLKETVLPLKRDQIDIKRVKYFLNHVVTAHIKISERDKAKTELKSHLKYLRDVPGISNTARVEEALNVLEDKIHNALQKERELIAENKAETTKIKELTKEVEQLRKKLREADEKIIKEYVKEVPKKRVKDLRSVLRLEKQIKNVEEIHNKFKKVKKHKKEAKVIESKLKLLKERLKKTKN